MKAVTEQDIRASFINCSQGEVTRLPVPLDLAERPWDDLDFLGWPDRSAPDRSYLVTERDDRLIGVTLQYASTRRGFLRRNMCSLCLTTHSGSGVTLMTGRKAGLAGRRGDSVGLYMCTDLACSLYVRGKKPPEIGGRLQESLTVAEQVARTRTNLFAFLDRLVA